MVRIENGFALKLMQCMPPVVTTIGDIYAERIHAWTRSLKKGEI